MVSEKDLEAETRREIELMGGWLLKFVSPGKRGVPDRLGLLPGGKMFFVEFKSTGKTLEPLQKWWRKVIIALGFKHYVVDDWISYKIFIDEVRAS